MLGEDDSDVETLREFISRLSRKQNPKVKGYGFGSCGELIKKGWMQLKLYKRLGCSRFVVCYDADTSDPVQRYNEVLKRVIQPSAVQGTFCILVPIQEMEAWMLADIQAAKNIFTGWRPLQNIGNPENISNPKEYLKNLSKGQDRYPRYSHATHNPQMAKHVDLDLVYQKCPSFRPLVNLVRNGDGNV